MGNNMRKLFLVHSVLLLTILSCQSNIIEQNKYDFKRDTPEWLKSKIYSIAASDNKYYFGTEVHRYKWNDTLLFEFDIPLSSCKLCELYYYDGTKTNFPNDSTAQNYAKNRTDKFIVWKREAEAIK
jgi:hypothetical protein